MSYNYKKYYKDNKEKINMQKRKYMNNYREKNKESIKKWKQSPRGIITRLKWIAKKKKIPFNLTKEDIVIPNYCPVLGIKLEYGQGSPIDNSPSVDRIIPKKGYTKGNIQIISLKANRIKTDATIEEIEKVLNYLKRL